MTFFDAIVALFLVGAVVGGWRLGFLARAASWLGIVAGLVVGAVALGPVLGLLPDAAGREERFLVATAVLIGGGVLGQICGLVLGNRVRGSLPRGPVRDADRWGGAVAGGIGVVVVVWLLLPAATEVPGWMATSVRSSAVAEWMGALPDPPDTVGAFRDLVGRGGDPDVLATLGRSAEVGPAPTSTGLSDEVTVTATASVGRVEGWACGRLQEGSGFVIDDGLVVTNAHVVAGQAETTITFPASSRHYDARVVAFDADRDVALLAVDGLVERPLPLAAGAEEGTVGGVFGFPGGGALEQTPYRIADEVRALGRDLANSHDVTRSVLVLASDVRAGDSGAPLVGAEGEVVGMAFAVAPDRPGVSYALAPEEVAAVVAEAGSDPVSTGACLH